MTELEQTDRGEARLIRETGVEARVASIVEPLMDALGYRLVRVRMSAQNGLTLQIMAERLDGSMDVEGCEELSRVISPALDVDDPVDRAYNLEISSPGIDRPLVRRSDFEKWRGHLARIETGTPIGGRKRFRGAIAEVGDDRVMIMAEAESGQEEVAIPFDALVSARLVLTDELVRDALKADRRQRRQARKSRGQAAAGNE